MAGFNFGAFFGNNSNNSGGLIGSFNFSDYSSIKNGSYKKLVKSYYAKDKIGADDSKSNKTNDNDKKKVTKIDSKVTTGLSKMKQESDALAASVDALGKNDLWATNDGKHDIDKITDAVKSFVGDYNNTISQSLKVTNSDISQQASNMQRMTNTLSKSLSKVGITIGTDGKLAVNEDKLKASNVKDIKELFDGTHSYAAQIQKYAKDVSKAVVNSSSIYSASGSLSSTLQGMFNDYI